MAELIVGGHFAEIGYNVAYPVSDNQPYDIIVEGYDEFLKVQVKLLYKSSPNRYSTGNDLTKYKEGDFDLLAVVFPETHEVRVLTFDEMEGKRRLSFIQ